MKNILSALKFIWKHPITSLHEGLHLLSTCFYFNKINTRRIIVIDTDDILTFSVSIYIKPQKSYRATKLGLFITGIIPLLQLVCLPFIPIYFFNIGNKNNIGIVPSEMDIATSLSMFSISNKELENKFCIEPIDMDVHRFRKARIYDVWFHQVSSEFNNKTSIATFIVYTLIVLFLSLLAWIYLPIWLSLILSCLIFIIYTIEKFTS